MTSSSMPNGDVTCVVSASFSLSLLRYCKIVVWSTFPQMVIYWAHKVSDSRSSGSVSPEGELASNRLVSARRHRCSSEDCRIRSGTIDSSNFDNLRIAPSKDVKEAVTALSGASGIYSWLEHNASLRGLQ